MHKRPGYFARSVAALSAALALTICAPLSGLLSAQVELAPYLEFPPRTIFISHLGFSWSAFVLVAVLSVVILAFTFRGLKLTASLPAVSPSVKFPVWGAVALFALAVSWILAWIRQPWFSSFQIHTFAFLWFSYTAVVNAFLYRRTGKAPLLDRPLLFGALFPASACFWWLFEYLNRFVQNWEYQNIWHFSAADYFLFSSLSFSTVLPSMLSTKLLIESFIADAHCRMNNGSAFCRKYAPHAALASGVLAMFFLPLFPNILFPLVWIAPPLIVYGLFTLTGSTDLAKSARAACECRALLSWLLAGLICGFFWEMWNYYSLAKWIYHVPLVSRFYLFEMPLLGFLGYLPFGLLCGLVVECLGTEYERRG